MAATTFMVERYVPGLAIEEFEEAVQRAAAAAETMTEHGTPVRYLRSVYVPAEECSFCCFEAMDAGAVCEANRRADVPFWRVVRAVSIEPMSPRAGADPQNTEGGTR